MSEVWTWFVKYSTVLVSAAVGGFIASLGWVIDRYRSRGVALTNARRDRMQMNIDDNAADICAVEDEVGSLRGRVSSLEKSDTRMSQKIDQLQASVAKLSADQVDQKRFRRVEQQVDAIYNHVLSKSDD